MAGTATTHLSTNLVLFSVVALLFCLTGLHTTTAYIWDSANSGGGGGSSSSTARRHNSASGTAARHTTSRNPLYHVNHVRPSRSSSNYNGGATRGNNNLVRPGGAKSADRYGSGKAYMYEHLQRGSVTLPKGGRAFLQPDQNGTLAYTAQLDAKVYPPKSQMHGRGRGRSHRARHMDWANGRRTHDPATKTTVVNGLCIKCPAEKTAIARKGLDGVLIEPPMLTTCRNQPISRELYELETLFGTKFNFILPHSVGGTPYSFLAKIINKRSGKSVQTCDLRYKVIVKQCGRYHPKSKDLKMACDLGHIWGSRCTFHCRNGGYPSMPNAFVECNEDQRWEGEEPHCLYNDVSEDYAYESDAPQSSDCTYLTPPNNGRFACEMKPTAAISNDLDVPNGTVCRIKCNESYEIPHYLRDDAVFSCHEGRWNSTMRHFCHPAGAGMRPKRRNG